jgi:hypothetical protein
LKFSRKPRLNSAARDPNMNFSNVRSALSRRLSSLRSKLRDDPDLLGKAALVLFVTGAVMLALGLALG